MMYILSSGHYQCPDYREKTYYSKSWLWKHLQKMNYPHETLVSGAKWNYDGKPYKLEIYE